MKTVGIIKGDGIGNEISRAIIEIFKACDVPIVFEELQIGCSNIKKGLPLLPPSELKKIKDFKVVLKAPLTTPIGKGFSSINVQLRKELDLDINFRPVKTIKGIKTPFQNVDIITIRENIQGMYSGIGQERSGNIAKAVSVMDRDLLVLFFRKSFKILVKEKRKNVLIVHKANILKTTSGMFLETGLEIAKEFPELNISDMIVDATAMNLVKDPSRFDSIVTSNLFGDILSDLCAGLVGGLGVAGGANLGSEYAIFEAVHGTAPDIAGKDLANPTAFLLSACFMLEHLDLTIFSDRIKQSLETCLESEETRTKDLGGKLGLSQFVNAIITNL